MTRSPADALVVRRTGPIEIDRVAERARDRGVEAAELFVDGRPMLGANLGVELLEHRRMT